MMRERELYRLRRHEREIMMEQERYNVERITPFNPSCPKLDIIPDLVKPNIEIIIEEEDKDSNENDSDKGSDEANDEGKLEVKDSDSQTTEELLDDIMNTTRSEGSELSELSRVESHSSSKDEEEEQKEEDKEEDKEDGDVENPKSVTFVDDN